MGGRDHKRFATKRPRDPVESADFEEVTFRCGNATADGGAGVSVRVMSRRVGAPHEDGARGDCGGDGGSRYSSGGGGGGGAASAGLASEDTTGMEVWTPVTQLCVRYLQQQEEGRALVQGARLVEVGAGLGVAGLLAAQLGASSAILTDSEPAALTLLRRNVAANPVVGCDISCGQLDLADIRRVQAVVKGSTLRLTLVLALELVFCEKMARLLLAALPTFLASGYDGEQPRVTLLLGHTVRRSIYMDTSGKLATEANDSALQLFLMVSPSKAR